MIADGQICVLSPSDLGIRRDQWGGSSRWSSVVLMKGHPSSSPFEKGGRGAMCSGHVEPEGTRQGLWSFRRALGCVGRGRLCWASRLGQVVPVAPGRREGLLVFGRAFWSGITRSRPKGGEAARSRSLASTDPRERGRGLEGGGRGLPSPWRFRSRLVTWLILPVVICLSQRLSHACLSINELIRVKLRMAH